MLNRIRLATCIGIVLTGTLVGSALVANATGANEYLRKNVHPLNEFGTITGAVGLAGGKAGAFVGCASANSAKHVAARSMDGGQSWPSQIIEATSPSGGYCEIANADGTDVFVSCYATSNSLRFIKTTDAGFSWSAPQYFGYGTNSDACTMAAVNATTYYLVTSCASGACSPATKFQKTTDGGTTWSPLVTIVGGSSGVNSMDFKDANHFVVWIVLPNDPVMNACYSTNAGDTFTCNSLPLTSASDCLDVKHVAGSTYVALWKSGNDLKFSKSTNDGVAWTTFAIPGTGVPDAGCEIEVLDANRYAIAYAKTGSSNRDLTFNLGTTSDGGQTWTLDAVAPEPAGEGVNYIHDVALAADATGRVDAWFMFRYDYAGTGDVEGIPRNAIRVHSLAAFGLGPEALVTVEGGNLNGFDVDNDGTRVIARHDAGGHKVTSYAATTLATVGGPVHTKCNRSDGVLASSAMLAFLACNNANVTEFLSLRNQQLAVPAFGGLCHDTSFCPSDIDLQTDFAGADPTNWDQLDNMQPIPLDWSVFTRGSGLTGLDKTKVAWVFTTGTIGSIPGDFGVAAHTAVNNDNDVGTWAVEDYAPTQVDHVCTWQGVGGAIYVAVASPQTTTRVYQVFFTNETREGVKDILVPQIGRPAKLSSAAAGQAIGIGCAQDKVLVATAAGQVKLLSLTNGTTLWTKSANTRTRGVVLSDDGKWAAWVDGGVARVAHAKNGTETGSLLLPPGTFYDVEMDAFGQQLWVATDSNIARYRIVPYTTVVDVFGLTDPTQPGEGGGELGPVGSGDWGRYVTGAGHPGVELALSFATIALCAIGAWKLTGGRVGIGGYQPGNAVVIAVSAFFGMCLSVFAWDFPLAIPLMVAVGAVALIVHRFWGGAGAG